MLGIVVATQKVNCCLQHYFDGYYLPGIEEFSRRCQPCQIHGNIVRQHSAKLSSIENSWYFAIRGMDFFGPFSKYSRGAKFFLVLVNYITKWVEAKPLSKMEGARIRKFLWSDIIYKCGLPLAIITDNCKFFDNQTVKGFCDENRISLCFASVAHP